MEKKLEVSEQNFTQGKVLRHLCNVQNRVSCLRISKNGEKLWF